jgi:translocation protein SEC66
MAANMMFRQKLDDIQAQTEAEVEWWTKRRASIQDEFMKELDGAPGIAAKTSKPGSDEDAVMVEAEGTAATGSIRKKKGKK